MKGLRIVIVTFAWPPRNSIGAHRPYSWARYWSAAGAQVRVLTARKYAYDEPLDLNLPPLPNVEVIETDYASDRRSLATHIFGSSLRKPARWLYRKLQGKVFQLPNPREEWLAAVSPSLNDLSQSCDIVVSTYDPRTVHQIAAQMKCENPDLIWIADYRDLWSLNHISGLSAADREAECQLELATVGRYADLVCSVSNDLAEQQGAFVAKPFLTIANGFDVDKEDVDAALSSPLRSVSGVMKIVYTGKLYPDLRDPLPLLQAIVGLESDGMIAPGDVELHLYGGQLDGLQSIVRSGQYDHILRLHGHVSREIALSAQAEAHFLLLLESPRPDARGVLTGKVFEYIASGVPILSLGSRRNSAIGRLLAQTGTGLCTEDNTEIIRGAILSRIEGAPEWFAPNFDQVAMFSRERQAAILYEAMHSLYQQKYETGA